MVQRLRAASFTILGAILPAMLRAQDPAPAPRPAIDPAGVSGTRMLCGGGSLPPELFARFAELAGGANGRVVVVPTASETADDPAQCRELLALWQQRLPGAVVTLLHTRHRAEADDEAFGKPLQTATGVWFVGGAQERLAAAYVGTRVERELMALLARNGVVGGTSAGTAILTRTMIQEGQDDPVMAQGFDGVPFAISDQHFLKRHRLPRLLRALQKAPGHFGLGVDEGTAVEVAGRTLRVLGRSKAVLALPEANGTPARIVELAAGESADLVTWQRAAIARAAAPWPPEHFAEPRVANGSLVIVGGGQLPDAIVDRFVALAGGTAARVVLVPSAAPAGERGPEPFERLLRARGVSDVRTLDGAGPTDVTAERLAVLADATAVWFGGGRQWRLVDAFADTPAVAAFAAVLARGGVIGGSSAGATIQGEFLVRGNPRGNTDMWCEGYDRGFAFLPGVAIDQHFVTRNRTGDLQALVGQVPQVIGLGIDEGTAAIVTGSVLEVLGDSKLAVFDARRGLAPTWLAAGARWDLVRGERP